MWGNCRLFLITRVCVVLTLFCLILNHASDWTAFEEGAPVRPLTSGWWATLYSAVYPGSYGRQKDSAIVLQGLHFFFPLNHCHMVNFLFCYGSLDMQWVFLGKGQFLLKYFWKKTIWQCRLLKLTTQC